MKIILSLFLLLGTCLTAQELLKNGTFAENPPDYGALPPAWQLDQPDSLAWGFVNDDGMNSAEALRCRLQPGQTAGTVSQKITCQADQHYILRADLKGSTAQPQVQVLTANGTVLASISAQTAKAGVWQEFSQPFTTAQDTALTVRLSTSGNAGTVFFDNLSLLPGQAAAPAGSTGSAAPRPFVAPGPNLAQGKPYTMSRKPNYGLCSDAGDATQLTDGVYTKGYFWTQKSTVGWSHAFLHNITIDLGKTEPICGVSWNAAAGSAGVTWPSLLSLYVSEDAQNWYFLGDIFTQSIAQYGRPAEDKYNVYRIASTSLARFEPFFSRYSRV